MTKEKTKGGKKRQVKKIPDSNESDGGDNKVNRQASSSSSETPAKRKRKAPTQKRPKKTAVEPDSASVVDDGWTPSDVEMLKMAIGACDSQDIHFWRNVALRVPGKTPLECNEKLIRMGLTVIQVKIQQREEDVQEEEDDDKRRVEEKRKKKLARLKRAKEKDIGDVNEERENGEREDEERGVDEKEQDEKMKYKKNDKTTEQKQSEHANGYNNEGDYDEEKDSQNNFMDDALSRTPDSHRKARKRTSRLLSGSPVNSSNDSSRDSPVSRKKARKSAVMEDVGHPRKGNAQSASEFDAEYRKFHAKDDDDEVDVGIRRLGNKFAPDDNNSYALPGEDEAEINFGPGLRKPGKAWDWRY